MSLSYYKTIRNLSWLASFSLFSPTNKDKEIDKIHECQGFA